MERVKRAGLLGKIFTFICSTSPLLFVPTLFSFDLNLRSAWHLCRDWILGNLQLYPLQPAGEGDPPLDWPLCAARVVWPSWSRLVRCCRLESSFDISLNSLG